MRETTNTMKTTLDIPDDLLRATKMQAVQAGRKFKDVAAEIFRRGLSRPPPAASRPVRQRVKLPLIKAEPGARPFALTGARIHELELESERESYEASLRR